MISLDDVRAATRSTALETDEKGRVRLKQGLTLAEKSRTLKACYKVYQRAQTAWRFLLGNMVNDLKLPYGQKVKHCKKLFGEHAGQTVYGYSVVAANWLDFGQDFPWSWELFKVAGILPDDLKCDLQEQYTVHKLDVDECKEYCRKWREKHDPRNSSRISSGSEDEGNSALVLSSSLNAEFLAAVKAARFAATRADALAIIDAAQCRLAELPDQEDEE